MITSDMVARAIISEMNKRGYSIGSVKLHKLLYFVFGLYLMNRKKHLFEDDYPMTFPYGPLFPNMQFKIKTNKINFDEKDYIFKPDNDEEKEDWKYIKLFIENACDILGKYTASKLSNWSHRENGAWFRTIKNGKKNFDEDSCTLIDEKYIVEEMEHLSSDETVKI